jgi:hypothetical protein
MARQSEQLEHQAERARDELAASLDQLRLRLTPGQMVDEATRYLRETPVADFCRNLGREIREHPLPLLVIFAGITWAIVATARSQRKATPATVAIGTEPMSIRPTSTPGSRDGWPIETAPVSPRQEQEVAPLNETVE